MTEKILPNLKMPPLNTTLMGVIKGVSDYFGLGYSDAWLYGGSGHAFLINIPSDLCPSGPYVWNHKPFYKLVRNLGIETTDLGFSHATPEERRRIEGILKKSIDSKMPCALRDKEDQIISGYDDTHFIVQKPWPQIDYTPDTLTFETWKEVGGSIGGAFYTFTKIPSAPEKEIVRDSLNYAVDLVQNPTRIPERTSGTYCGGLEAYDTWIQAVKDGLGSSHGNWWNGTVWWECREMAVKYFEEIAAKIDGISQKATNLNSQYKKVAEFLGQAKDKQLAEDKKIRALEEARKVEESCIKGIKELLLVL